MCELHSAYKFWRVFNHTVDAIMIIEYQEHLISAVLNSFLQTGTELKILSALETIYSDQFTSWTQMIEKKLSWYR